MDTFKKSTRTLEKVVAGLTIYLTVANLVIRTHDAFGKNKSLN